MTDLALSYESYVRLASFGAVFLLMASWERVAPRRVLRTAKWQRWFRNLTIVVLNTAVLRLLFPAAAVGMAWMAEERSWGLLNNVSLPYWVELLVSVVALDLLIYLQHVMFHAVPALWRLHMVHHADLDFDLTTGNRFHPLEIVFSMLIKTAAVAALGPPAVAVLVFEVLLNATAMFNHANVRIPRAVDRVLRWFVVTPDMHRVHHSILALETNSNFGFNLPWWDRLLGTYRNQPRAGHEEMIIGLRQFRDSGRLGLPRMLLLPFVGDIGGYSFARSRRGRPSREPEAAELHDHDGEGAVQSDAVSDDSE
jgi:sterol desaturase/sphingolipid hydroxylase (fatty acid hydroxylase superfamily)